MYSQDQACLHHPEEGFTPTFLCHIEVKQGCCHNPTLAKREDETHTPKVGDLESFGTPEFLEFDSKAQNTSH
jgi:hypothetical protein